MYRAAQKMWHTYEGSGTSEQIRSSQNHIIVLLCLEHGQEQSTRDTQHVMMHFRHGLLLNVRIEWVSQILRIHEVSSSTVGPRTGFSWHVQTNYETVYQITP